MAEKSGLPRQKLPGSPGPLGHGELINDLAAPAAATFPGYASAVGV